MAAQIDPDTGFAEWCTLITEIAAWRLPNTESFVNQRRTETSKFHKALKHADSWRYTITKGDVRLTNALAATGTTLTVNKKTVA